MTAVYSGGLAYEYSEEGNKYGLGQIEGGSYTEGEDFKYLKDALSATQMPSGDGGYNQTGGASGCPAQSANWPIANNSLPAIPQPAEKFMKEGAGKGEGFGTFSSQTAGTPSSGYAESGSGTGTSGSSSSGRPSSAAAALRVPEFGFAPVAYGLVAIVSTFVGAALL